MKVYFSTSFVRSYCQAPKSVQQAFQRRLHLFMVNPNNPVLQLRQFSDAFAAYYAMLVTPTWDVIVHQRATNFMVFDTLSGRTQTYV